MIYIDLQLCIDQIYGDPRNLIMIDKSNLHELETLRQNSINLTRSKTLFSNFHPESMAMDILNPDGFVFR